MSERITIEIPEKLETLLKKVVTATNETREVVWLDWVVHPVPEPTTENFNHLLEEISHYTPIQLWTVVYRQLPSEIENRHQAIVEKHEAGQELSPEEETDWGYSVELSEIYTLLRSQALVQLKEAGKDINIFLNRELD